MYEQRDAVAVLWKIKKNGDSIDITHHKDS